MKVGSAFINGNLAYTTGYTGFDGSHEELQSGNYLALKFEATEDATVTVQLIGAAVTKNPVELDSDMNMVLRITDPANQKIKVVVSKDGYEDLVKTYRLTGLKLAAPSASNSEPPSPVPAN